MKKLLQLHLVNIKKKYWWLLLLLLPLIIAIPLLNKNNDNQKTSTYSNNKTGVKMKDAEAVLFIKFNSTLSRKELLNAYQKDLEAIKNVPDLL